MVGRGPPSRWFERTDLPGCGAVWGGPATTTKGTKMAKLKADTTRVTAKSRLSRIVPDAAWEEALIDAVTARAVTGKIKKAQEAVDDAQARLSALTELREVMRRQGAKTVGDLQAEERGRVRQALEQGWGLWR